MFALRNENRITVLPLDIPQPNRSLGILRRAGPGRSQAADRFAAHVVAAFDDLKHLIERHENAVIWGRSGLHLQRPLALGHKAPKHWHVVRPAEQCLLGIR